MQVVSFFAITLLVVLFAVASPALWRWLGREPTPMRRALRIVAIVLWIVVLIAVAVILVDYALHGGCDACPDFD